MPRNARPSSVLGRLLEAAGYRVEMRNDATIAVRAKDHRAVVIVATPRSPAEIEALLPPDAVLRIVVYDDEPGPVARALAADRGIEVLDPSNLGSALGELLLPSPAGTDEPPRDGDGSTALDPPFPIAPEGERTVRPRIGREEAETLAGVESRRYVLRLVPFYVAAYQVRPPSPQGGTGTVTRGLVAVNSLTRRAEVWDTADRELVSEIEGPHQRLDPQLSDVQATPIARETIRQFHTIHVDHTEQHGGALVIESRRIPPAIEDVRLGPFVLLYVPFWYAEGPDGRVVLDAVSGARIAGSDAAPMGPGPSG
jgi:hypothetical protein